jgi:hypothetical protein
MGTEKDKAAADLTLIAFYYLLRVGEYTVKGLHNSTKQTVQFKYEDVTFFRKINRGELRCLPQDTRTTSLHPPMVQLLSWTTRRMVGKACVYTMRQMGTICIAQCKHSGVATYTFANMGPQPKLSSQHISQRQTNGQTSQTRTSVWPSKWPPPSSTT